MLYFAHRGASARQVQNTVAAFSLARRLGASCYELDVHVTKDGALAVHHDYSLLSTAGADVLLKDLTRADLLRYPLFNRFDGQKVFVPELKDILPVVEPGLYLLNIELKNDGNCYPGLEKRVLSELQKRAPQMMPKILFSSFDYDTLARMRQLNKNARIGLLTRAFDVSQALGLGAESVHMNYTRFTPEIAQVCHRNGLKIYLYTVNEVPLAHTLQAQGADGIFTDCIESFVSACSQ